MDVVGVSGVFLVKFGWQLGSVVAILVMFILLVATSILVHMDVGR